MTDTNDPASAPGEPAADSAPPPSSDTEAPPGAKSHSKRSAPEPTGPTVVVRYGLMRFLGEFRCALKTLPAPRQSVVVRTDRGVELGRVVSIVQRGAEAEAPVAYGHISAGTLNRFLTASGENYPFRRGGRVLRMANPQDLIDFRHLQSSAREESKYCREQITALTLPMRLVTAEHMLGGERIVFYFTADSRVDFRSLVRDLAGQFRTRIEMRQVGARDEARLVADYERCGQRCCCQEYLKDLKPVSMRMAKVQKATLDPAKISGRCGRLMCCLRYEDECYEELRKHLPKRNMWVRTDTLIGRVLETQIITQLVRLFLPDGSIRAVPVEEIVERNVQPPTEEELREHAIHMAAAQRQEAARQIEQIAVPMEEDAEEPAGKEIETPSPRKDKASSATRDESKPKRKSRRRRKSSTASDRGANAPKSSKSSKAGGSTKRRRRRRKKKPGGSESG